MTAVMALLACENAEREQVQVSNVTIDQRTILRIVLSQIAHHNEQRSSAPLRSALSQLKEYACKTQNVCTIDPHMRANNFSLVNSAYMFLQSASAEQRGIGLKLACALCDEEQRACTCDDSRECEVDDVMVTAPAGIDYRLECGALVRRDGVKFLWGSAVRALNAKGR